MIFFTLFLPTAAFSGVTNNDLPDCTNTPSMQKFLDDLAANNEGTDAYSTDFGKKNTLLEKFIKRCGTHLNASQSNCFSNAVQFFSAMKDASKPSHAILGTMSDREIFRRAKSESKEMVDLPDFLLGRKTAEDLENFFSRCKSNPNRKECVSAKDCKMVQFTSADCTQMRKTGIIQCQYNQFDKWFLLRGENNDLSFLPTISVLKRNPKDNRVLSEPVPFFLVLDKPSGSPHQHQSSNDGKCMSCHGGGLNTLNPIPGSITFGDLNDIEAMNSAIKNYGMLDLSWTKNHLQGRAVTASACTSCHNGYERNEIYNFRFFQRVLIEGMMPLHPKSHPSWDMHQALKKVQELDKSDRDKVLLLYRPQSTEAWKDGICNEKKTAGIRREILNLLFERGKISPQEHARALEGVNLLEIEGPKLTGEIVASKTPLSYWLKGNRENCLGEQPPGKEIENKGAAAVK